MRKVISLILSLVMLTSITAGLDFSAKADTNPTDIVDISAGKCMSALVRQDGSVWTWGCSKRIEKYSGYGPADVRNQSLGVASGAFVESTPMVVINKRASSVVCSLNFADTNFSKYSSQSFLGAPITAVLKDDNSLWMWGANKNGALGNGSQGYSWKPTKVLDNVISYDTSGNHSAAVTADGSLYMWGNNAHGELGNGSNESLYSPTKIMDNVASVSLGAIFSAAIKKDGSLWLWGSNSFGQLGNGTTENSNIPIKVLDSVDSISLGYSHCLAKTKNKALYVWGSNGLGQLGIGNNTNKTTPTLNENFDNDVKVVEAGSGFSAAITENGDLYTWGNNNSGQLGDESTTIRIKPTKILRNIKLISLGASHALAVSFDNTLFSWGSNSEGELGDRSTVSKTYPNEVFLGRIDASFRGDGISEKELDIPWSDTFLNQNSSDNDYNKDMAISGIVLSEAAYNSATNVLNQFGYSYATGRYNTSMPSYMIGYRVSWGFDNPQINIIMTIRGTLSSDDIMTDIQSITDNFDGAGNYLVNALSEAENTISSNLSRNNIDISLTKRNTKYFVTGHSLGGGCAGKVGLMLVDKGLALANNVYVYTFAATTFNTDITQNYAVPRMFNIINGWDTVVPNIPRFMYNGIIPILAFHAGHDIFYTPNDGNSLFINSLYQLYGEAPGDRYSFWRAHMTPMYLAALLSSTEQSTVNRVFSKARLVSVHCPVEVEVYSSNGVLCAKTDSGNVVYSKNSTVLVNVIGDEKFIQIPDGGEYEIKYIGTDTGTMKIEDQIYDLESGEVESEKVFESVSLEEGKQFESVIDAEDTDKTDLFVVDNEGDKISSVDVNGAETDLYTYDITEHNIQISTDSYKYDGTAKTQTVSVDGLTEGTDYRVIYDNNIAVGTASVTVKGINDYYGRESKTFKIYDEGTCSETVSWKLSPSGTLTITGTGEIPNYDAENPAPWSAHTETITKIVINDGVTAIGNNAFAGCEKTSEIYIPSSVTTIGENATDGCSKLTNITYTGTSDEWNEITVGEGNAVVESTEKTYSSTESGHIWDAGVVTRTATCSAEGEMTYTCTECSITKTEPIAKIAHNYEANITKPTCVDKGYTTYTCTNCSDSYVSDYVNAKGHKIVTDKAVPATFKKAGKTTGSHCSVCGAVITAQKTVAKLGAAKLSKVTAGKKQFKATWKSVKNIDGYQIQYSTSSKFKSGNKTVTVKGYKSTSKTVKKLKAKKKYYVRIRAYKTINGKKQYSAWSSKKSVTIKK